MVFDGQSMVGLPVYDFSTLLIASRGTNKVHESSMGKSVLFEISVPYKAKSKKGSSYEVFPQLVSAVSWSEETECSIVCTI